MELRPYQLKAVQAVYEHLRTREDNPCVVIPTGGGKTPILARMCKDTVDQWGGRILILAHVRELLEQAFDKLMLMAPELRMRTGIYSAGLNSRDTDHEIIIAGIQSVYKKAFDLGRFDLCVVDEAHRVSTDNDETMYGRLLTDLKITNPSLRVVGLTATPYRLGEGMICDVDHVLNHVCYEVGVKELIVDGYLCPLKSKGGIVQADTEGLHIRAGEFLAEETERLMNDDGLVNAACKEIVGQTRERKSCLIFCSGVAHANHVIRVLKDSHGVVAEGVFGETESVFRDELIKRFKSGDLKYLVNVNVLTLGFDAPNVDCVALLRPTMSAGLYYQMVGRGLRLSPSKENCLVLDYGRNIQRHGTIDKIRPGGEKGDGEAPCKECPECREYVPSGCMICPECGHAFPDRITTKHGTRADGSAIVSGEVNLEIFDVLETVYCAHVKRDAGEEAPRTMRVDYRVGWNTWKSEWVCVEHAGYAGAKADSWWRKRCGSAMPGDADDAVTMAQDGELAVTKQITYRTVSGEKYGNIVGYELGEIPKPKVPALMRPDGTVDVSKETMNIPESELPF